MLKRLIGKLLVAGLLSGAAVFAAASPSSALPRDACMDQQHYFQQVQTYEYNSALYAQTLMEFQAAHQYTNPWGEDVWAVNRSGEIRIYTDHDYNTSLTSAQIAYDHAMATLNNFLETTTVCA